MTTKKLLALLLALLMVFALAACAPKPVAPAESLEAPADTEEAPAATEAEETAAAEQAPQDVITYNFLHCWNGGAYGFPDGWSEGVVAKAVTEKTGVQIVAETITSSETEKLALVFASGDVPDITNAPYWSTNPGGEGEQIKNAATQGMLLGLNQYMESYPNIKRAMTENINEVFREMHLEHPDYAGERYIIPNKPMTEADVTNWAYGIFARKDILEALNIDPKTVNTAEALYDLLVKIKNGGFVDINGKPVIPAGNWHNGWAYDQYLLSFQDGGFTNWGKDENGKVVMDVMMPGELEGVLFMRKLVSEGLYDAEALTQTDTMGKEKMATGRIATQGCHWPHMNGFFESTLYLTNPEMEYVTLGPFVRKDGTNPTMVNRKGVYGFGCLFLSADIEQPERALALIDYLGSDEGQIMSKFGIEGVHYDMVDGIPTQKPEWKEIASTDGQRYNLEGFGIGNLGTDDRSKSKGWDQNYNKPGYVYAREVRPLAFFEGYTVSDIAEKWPGRKAYDEKMSMVNYGDLKKVAITAASDEEATEIIEGYRQKMMDAGYEEMMAYVQAEVDKDPSIVD